MKRISIIISIASAALVLGSLNTYADHQKECKEGKHGRVTAKTDSSITVGGTTYNTASASVSREDGGALSAKSVNVGDKVCVLTASADSKDASKVVVLNAEAKGSPSSSSGVKKDIQA